jgi:thiosulfate/3-mercaptopyruvate sulfurtransferase
MNPQTLVSTTECFSHLDDPNWVIVDCRFTLSDPHRGERDYLAAHIPGARYAHLDRDLSAPVIPGKTGRHPLPEIDRTAQTFSRLGIGPESQVIAYDDAGGGLAAARLWWLLRWLGHTAAAVLDGGWQKWAAEGRPTRGGNESWSPEKFVPHPRPELVFSGDQVEQASQDERYRLVDVRAATRFSGQVEPIDPVAGHIPAARNAPYLDNLAPGGTFLQAEELRRRLLGLLGDVPAERVVFYCGSGVTAAQGVLAMLHSGLGEARLYAGSWSEWITDPERPVASG